MGAGSSSSSNTSYENLLQDLNSNVIIGPYRAFGLKKPGEERGVWLFGEMHEDGKREEGNIGESVYIGDVIAKYARDVILLYEGSGNMFGCGLFSNAPKSIKTMVSRQSDNKDYVECLLTPSEKDDVDLDNEGYNIHRASEDDLLMWKDEKFWEEHLREMNDCDFIAEKFRSKGGIGVNIDRPIRNYIFNGIIMNDMYRELDISGYVASVTWALNNISSSAYNIGGPDASLPPIAIGYINAFRNYLTHKFPMTVDHSMKNSMVSALAEMLKPTPPDLTPLFMNVGETNNQYRSVIALIMDLNVIEKIEYHSDKDIVVYSGAYHSINQLALLLKQGYVVQHYYANTSPNHDISFHRLSPTDKKREEDFSYDTTLDFMQNIYHIEKIVHRNDSVHEPVFCYDPSSE